MTDGETMNNNPTIGADGVHSQVRKTLFPGAARNILPFVVFNGKQIMKRETSEQRYPLRIEDKTVIELKKGNIILHASINDNDGDIVASVVYTLDPPEFLQIRCIDQAGLIQEQRTSLKSSSKRLAHCKLSPGHSKNFLIRKPTQRKSPALANAGGYHRTSRSGERIGGRYDFIGRCSVS
jgi:hypothetical protein